MIYEEPTVYSLYESILSPISVPLNLFTLFCIVKKSPPEMKEFRVHLVNYQLFTLALEFSLLSIKPELNFPALSGRILGIWDSVFHFGAKHALGVGGFLVGTTVSSINQLFFYKYQSFLPDNHPFKLRTLGWVIYFIFLYAVFPLWLFLGFELLPIENGTNNEIFVEMIEGHPSYFYLSFIPDLYVSSLRPIYPPYINFSAVYFVLAGIFVCTIVTGISDSLFIYLCNKLINETCSSRSEKTRQMQKKFFIALCIQQTIPMLAMASPWVIYGIIIAIGGETINQSLNNLLFGIVTSHGSISSISILLLTAPYRRFIFSFFKKLPLQMKLEKSFQISRKIRIESLAT